MATKFGEQSAATKEERRRLVGACSTDPLEGVHLTHEVTPPNYKSSERPFVQRVLKFAFHLLRGGGNRGQRSS